jgi:hypothetical protein
MSAETRCRKFRVTFSMLQPLKNSSPGSRCRLAFRSWNLQMHTVCVACPTASFVNPQLRLDNLVLTRQGRTDLTVDCDVQLACRQVDDGFGARHRVRLLHPRRHLFRREKRSGVFVSSGTFSGGKRGRVSMFCQGFRMPTILGHPP